MDAALQRLLKTASKSVDNLTIYYLLSISRHLFEPACVEIAHF
jgi:hypothetical protein